MKIAINRKIINKVDKSDMAMCWVLTTQFENVDLASAQLAEEIDRGHPFCAQHIGRRRGENFAVSGMLAVDIDDGMSLTDALAQSFVSEYAAILYTTPSHTPEKHRFRIVFELDRAITDADEMRAAYQGVIRKFGGDEKCKDACRLFFGSKGSAPIVLGNVLPNEQLDHLVALGREASSISDQAGASSKSSPRASRRSGISLKGNELVTVAGGKLMPLSDLPSRTAIHCPIHIDRSASAFTLQGKDGTKGVYCSSCAATFWPGPRSGTAASYDFYRTDDIIAEQEYLEDPDNFYDDDAPEVYRDIARKERRSHTMAHQYLPDLPVADGVTFIRSPKGSGKSEWLSKTIGRFRETGKSVLLVGHRQTLIESMADRLGLTCYFYSEDGKIKNNPATPYYAISLDSMSKLLDPERQKYDVVILDESEQVLSHLTGSTLDGKRRPCYLLLFHYLRGATSVIVADADLGPITIEGICQAIDKHQPYQFYLNTHRASRCDFLHYASDTHLLEEMLEAIRNGGRHYVVTNSLTRANELQEAIRRKIGAAPRIMLVTSKETGDPQVQMFIQNIKTEILNYDVVIASPTLGTGIDITFEEDSQHIDTVFGFFVARVNTHFDIDQQIARVRNPKAIKVWVSPQRFHFETEPEVIRREALLNGTLNDALIGYERDGRVNLDETYLHVYAEIVALSRASKNSLRENLIELRERNGWKVLYVEVDREQAASGQEVKSDAKNAVEKARIEAICAAPEISPEQYDSLRDATVPTKLDEEAMGRYEVERFYEEAISAELVALDDKGAYRRQIKLLATFLMPERELAALDTRRFELSAIVSDSEKRSLKRMLLRTLLTSAGLVKENRFDHEAVITSETLCDFVVACRANEQRLQNLLGICLRFDLEKKPVSQLTNVLGLIGLAVVKVDTKKVDGKKIYRYSLNKEVWDVAQPYVERRMAKESAKAKVAGANMAGNARPALVGFRTGAGDNCSVGSVKMNSTSVIPAKNGPIALVGF